MTAPRTVDVADVVERSRLGRFQLGAFALLCACLAVDGFDVQVMGYVAPALVRDWGLPTAAMSPVFGAGLLGLFLGSLLLGMAADRLGRRPVLVGSMLSFALFTLLAARAGSIRELAALRFLGGLGLGAMMPNATALVGEYTPRRHRVATMMIVTNGFLFGPMAGGFLSAWLIPAHGWRAVLWVGGVVPLALAVPMLLWLPESLQFLAVRGKDPARLARWVQRVDPGSPAGEGVRYVVPEARREGLPLVQLFGGGRAAGTCLLWTVNFMNVLVMYLVSSWLPAVVRDAGHSTRAAVLVGTALQTGGAIGTIVLGLVLEKVGFGRALTTLFAVAAAALAVLGRPDLPLAALVAVAFVVGWAILGGQPGVNAAAATYYPTDLRTTGLGAGLGVGRLGATLGPVLAGALLARGWSGERMFQAAALPALLATLASVALGAVLRQARAEARAPDVAPTRGAP